MILVDKTCRCGLLIRVPFHLKERKKYCSKVCFYKYRRRPSGLRYILVKDNPTSFKKGHIPKIKGKRGPFEGKTKDGLHSWVERNLGKPRECEFCRTKSSRIFQWSNKSGQYKPVLSDWQRLCVKCHSRYDYEKFGARKIFYEK